MLSQIENEYGNIEGSYGQKGKDYVKWAANMAVGLGAGVPWVMCKQTDAPEYIVPSYFVDYKFQILDYGWNNTLLVIKCTRKLFIKKVNDF